MPTSSTTAYDSFPVAITLTICLALSSIVALLRFPYTLDDAYITFHYARNFAAGYPLGTWNPGEPPVEGCSSLLWTLFLGWGFRMHLSPFYLSKFLGSGCALAFPIVTFAACRFKARRGGTEEEVSALACSSILMSLYVPLFYYGVTGMETTFFALQVLLLLLLPILSESHLKTFLSVVLTITLGLTRPEGLFLAVLVHGYALLSAKERMTQRSSIAGLIAVLGTVSCLTAFRWHQFHALLPNTYYAKATGGSSIRRTILGLRYLVRTMELTAPYLAVVLVLLARSRQSLKRKTYLHGLALISLAYVLYVVKVGGDPDSAFPLRRHFVHIAGLLALLLGSLIASRITSMSRACRLTTTLAAIAAVYISVGWCRAQFVGSFHLERQIGLFRLSPKSQLWTWFDQYATRQTLTAVTGAGEWPYNVEGNYIDMLGLNDSHIARMGKVDPGSSFQDSKSDMRYVLSRHPDILDGYMQASQLLRGECPAELHGNRALMLHDLVSNPLFQNDYVFIVNGPYRIMDRAIFFRADYARRFSKSVLLTIPVSQTALVTKKCIPLR